MSGGPVTLQIRRMRWWDLPRVVELDAALFPDTAWTSAMFWSELAGVPHTRDYVVAHAVDGIVGYGGVMTVARDATVQTLGVAPSWQRQGLGRRILDDLVVRARQRLATQVWLEVGRDNLAAVALYAAADFAPVSVRRDYYGAGRDAVIMRRRLHQDVSS